ncbi:hypothetical protein ACHAWT_005227 [Skeletonema menzelii]
MPRYRDDDRYYDEDRSYYSDEDDGGYSYGESYGDSYTSYRSRGSYNRGGGGGGRNRGRGGGNRRDNDYNNRSSNNPMRYRGPSNSAGGIAGRGAGAGAGARIYPQDNPRNGGGGVAFAEEENIYTTTESQMNRLTNTPTTATTNNKNKQLVDFDSYTSDAEKLSAILRVADVEYHKHALTSEYFTLRKYSILIPIIILSLFVAMAGFIAASDILNENTRVHDTTMQEFLTLLVASCGFIVLLLTLLGNQLDYNSKIKLHDGASDDLKELCDKIRMYRVERAMDERVVEEELAEVRRKEIELGELDMGDTESDESEVDEWEAEDERLLLDEEQGGGVGGGGGGAAAWDTVVQLNTGEVPPTLQQIGNGNGGGGGAIIAHQEVGTGGALTHALKKQAAMERKVARQAKKQLKLSKKLEKKNEYLTKELVNQKITQERQQQEMSKDIITFYGYHSELHQIISGCKSDVPPEISKFFHVMENRVELMSLSRLGIQEESRMRKNQIIRLCATEIYNEIQGFFLWPVTVPPVDSTIEESLRTVGQLLNMNYRAQRRCKLIPCCPIPLCCKKRTSNNIFSVINEGIDQRELDMMQAERVEVLRQVNERKARLMAGPAEVLELKDEESVNKATAMSKKPKEPLPWMIEQNNVHQQMKDYVDFGDGYSRATVDPDGSVMNEIMTEASDPNAIRNGVNNLGLYVHDEEEGIEEDGTGGGTFEGIAPAPKSEVYSQAVSQHQSGDGDEELEKAEKKAKKKKKKKQKKKNKKKSKKKAKEESEAASVYSEDEYDDKEYGSYDEDEGERSYNSEESGSY